ncbi:MAG: hypothetical protein AAF086_09730 [Planctomycetota bacterium]
MARSGGFMLAVACLAVPVWSEPAGGHRVEAESPKPKSDCRVVAIADEPDGQAVTSDRAWEPVFVTSDLGDWTGKAKVWVRHAGGPINLKAQTGSSQTELAWVWSAPDAMTWSAFGTFNREQLGEGVVIIRSDKGSPMIDAVVFEAVGAGDGGGGGGHAVEQAAADAVSSSELPTSIPDAQAPASNVSLFVDWPRTAGPITRTHWAVNDYSVLRPALSGQPAFNDYVAEVDPPIIRIHWANLADVWTDAATRTWDAAEMKTRLDEAVGYGDAEIMFCINWWPKWLHEGKVLPAEKEAEFVRLCAELPGVLRDIGHPAAMIEVPNELEGHYEKAGKLPQLWDLYKRCVKAIRDADPEVQVGGPALTWPKPSWMNSFVEHGGLDYADFFTWHNYGLGEATDPNEQLFAAAEKLGNHAVEAMQTLADAGHPDMPGYLTEYNVSWTWTTRDARMGTNVGAVFQALTVKNIATSGASGAFVWHVQDNIYGLLNNDGTRRAPAELFTWASHLSGQMSPVVTEDAALIEGLAVRGDDGHQALLLLVKADHAVQVHPNATLEADQPWRTVEAIVPEGFDKPMWVPGQTNALPGYSLLLLSTRE